MQIFAKCLRLLVDYVQIENIHNKWKLKEKRNKLRKYIKIFVEVKRLVISQIFMYIVPFHREYFVNIYIFEFYEET